MNICAAKTDDGRRCAVSPGTHLDFHKYEPAPNAWVPCEMFYEGLCNHTECRKKADPVAQIKAAIAEEREACAKIIDDWPDDGLIPATMRYEYEKIAAALRARP